MSPPDVVPPIPNPLITLSDDELWNNQILLQIQCRGNKFSIRKKRVDNLCALGFALSLEADRRGVLKPIQPYSVGNLKH